MRWQRAGRGVAGDTFSQIAAVVGRSNSSVAIRMFGSVCAIRSAWAGGEAIAGHQRVVSMAADVDEFGLGKVWALTQHLECLAQTASGRFPDCAGRSQGEQGARTVAAQSIGWREPGIPVEVRPPDRLLPRAPGEGAPPAPCRVPRLPAFPRRGRLAVRQAPPPSARWKRPVPPMRAPSAGRGKAAASRARLQERRRPEAGMHRDGVPGERPAVGA